MNIAVAQSGGPTCAINASLVGVFEQALKTPEIDAVFGSINGIEGIIKDNLIDLKSYISTNEDIELLKQTPSTALGSCRYKLPDVSADEEVYKKIMDCFARHDIRAFFYIGGNDSMDTVDKLSAYAAAHSIDIRIIGVPKTIDNDLCVTDHTPGFGSAAKYVATTVQEIMCDSRVYSIQSVTIIEIMGRHAGWLTASTCVLRANGEIAPHLIYLPEGDFDTERFLSDVRREMAKHKAVIVAVSEGIQLSGDNREYVVDNFGHKYLSGIGKQLENLVRDRIGCKVRSIELNVMQRCSSHICSKTDIDESVAIGSAAVRAALNGETGRMMAFKRISDMPYMCDIVSVPVSEVANEEKAFPREWITPDGTNVNEQACRYFLPLIQGDLTIKKTNGIPRLFKIHEELLR